MFIFSFGTDSSPTLLEDVSCLSSDLLVLLQCSVTEQYSASCSSNTQNDLIVQCCKCLVLNCMYHLHHVLICSVLQLS